MLVLWLMFAGLLFVLFNFGHGIVTMKKSSIRSVAKRFPLHVVSAFFAMTLFGAATVIAPGIGVALIGILGYTLGLTIFVYDTVKYVHCRRILKAHKILENKVSEMLSGEMFDAPADLGTMPGPVNEFKW